MHKIWVQELEKWFDYKLIVFAKNKEAEKIRLAELELASNFMRVNEKDIGELGNYRVSD